MHHIIIDCDPGHDDIMSIFTALAYDSQITIEGYSTVCGNNLLSNVTRNLGHVFSKLNLKGDIYLGAECPLVYQPEPQDAHGVTGLDGPIFTKEPISYQSLSAVEFMAQTCERLGHIEIVAIGPLTNVATFLRDYPQYHACIDAIYIMGGSRASGNIVKYGEFNIYADPHAAKIVFDSGVPCVIADLEICKECGTPLCDVDTLNGKGPVQQMAFDLLNFFGEYSRIRKWPDTTIFDVVPTMYMIHPELFEIQHVKVDVLLDGEETRGQTIMTPNKNSRTILLEHLKDRALYNRYFFDGLEMLEKKVSRC